MISIVMSYYNRLRQFDYTLKTIRQSQYKDCEIVLIDDYSDPDHDPRMLLKKYSDLDIKITRMQDVNSHRWYSNPCVPYNIGFRLSRGDTIIIQNPECCHIGDVIGHCAANINDEVYLSYHCWSCTKDQMKLLHNDEPISYEVAPKAMWYNHEIHRPASYHFCTALTRKNLQKLNGFDERFAIGFSYDDDEFIQRVKNLALKIQFVADPHVVHQPHPKFLTHGSAMTNNESLFYSLKNTGLITAPNKEPIP